jgi:hypothetical protein
MHALLLAGILAAPLGFAGLLMPVKRHACTVSGPWPAIRRLVLAVVATTALAAVVAVSLRLLRVSGHGQAGESHGDAPYLHRDRTTAVRDRSRS